MIDYMMLYQEFFPKKNSARENDGNSKRCSLVNIASSLRNGHGLCG